VEAGFNMPRLGVQHRLIRVLRFTQPTLPVQRERLLESHRFDLSENENAASPREPKLVGIS